MRIPLIAANWKMNTNIDEALSLINNMLPELDTIAAIEKVICPPFICLSAVKECLQNTSIKLGAQNMFYKDNGAFTGEISSFMLVNLVIFVILGHSERRQLFFETDEVINKKLSSAFNRNIKPIFCIGESEQERSSGRTEETLKRQLTIGLQNIKPDNRLVIAYEPIWAIGTGNAATGRQASSTIASIRRYIAHIWNEETAKSVRILYGGSVTASNIYEFVRESEIDGALVGGASLKSDEFINIVRITAQLKAAK